MQQPFLKGKTMPYPGEIIGGTYQIIEEIGTGGVGIIYRAYHLNLRKNVVVKKIKENFAGALEARGEVDILKSLHHSNLPQVYDFLQVGNEVYTVMDYIDGHDLKYYLDQGYYFEESLLWQWMTQLCEVLEYLHDHGILHLDIKPANIMLTSEGKLYLIDFNISFSGEVENMSGISPYYASPEQYQNWNAMLYGELQHLKSLDESTDIYSLGATFYHLMSGIQPTSQLEYLVPITRYQLEYSPALIAMINKMMSPKKENRYHSTKKILDVIRKAQRTREEKRTLRMVFWGMTCAVIILLGTMGILFFRGGTNSLDSEQIRQQENRLW